MHSFRSLLGATALPFIVAGCAASSAAAPTLPQPTAVAPSAERAALTAALDSIVRAWVAAERTAGLSVAVMRGRDTLLLRGYGLADASRQVPTPQGAVYEVASVTKQFTAAAVLQLVEQGKISLDAEITQYLPDYPTHGERITVRRLLNHTAGIHGISLQVPRYQAMATRSITPDSLIAIASAQALDFVPGTAMIYSNSGYVVAGQIIETVAGMPLREYVQRHILAPLGMTDTRDCDRARAHPHQVTGHMASAPGRFSPAPLFSYDWMYAVGSLCSSAGDILAWQSALHSGGVLRDVAYRQLVTPDTLLHGHRLRYAMGLEVKPDAAGHLSIGHGGTSPGFVAEARYYPDHDLQVVVLMNTLGGGANAEAVAEELAARILGPGTHPPAVAYTGDLDALAGTYVGTARNQAMTIVIARGDNGLTARLSEAGRPLPIRHIGDGTFAFGKARFMFVGSAGQPPALHFDSPTTPGHYILERQH